MATSTCQGQPFDVAEIEAFLIHEARLLDERRLEDWAALFDDDSYYWVPLRPGQPNPDDEASLFYDDKPTLLTRIERLRHPDLHIEDPPSRTCHIIGGIALEHTGDAKGSGGECQTVSAMIVADYRLGETRLFAGQVRHRLRRTDTGWRIRWKKVELINCDETFGQIAMPL